MSTDTVTVALKHPHGVVLRIFDMQDVQEPTRDGTTKRVKRAQQRMDVKPFTIRGYLEPNRDPASLQPSQMSRFGITRGVPKDIWERWLAQNQDLALVENRLIFGFDDEASVSDMARDMERVSCGLEPLDPQAMREASERARARAAQAGVVSGASPIAPFDGRTAA